MIKHAKTTSLTSSCYVDMKLSKDVMASHGIECVFSMIQSEWFNRFPQMVSKRRSNPNKKKNRNNKNKLPSFKDVLSVFTVVFALCAVGAIIQATTMLIYEILR